MKKSIISILIIGIVASINVNCGDENPASVNPPIDNSKIDWPNIEIIRDDSASMNDNFIWKIIIDKKSKIDSIKTKDSIIYGDGSLYISPDFGKQELKDTITLVAENLGDDNSKNYMIIRIFKNGYTKDTTDCVLVIDTQKVQILRGSFYTQNLKKGDSLNLFVNVSSNSTPYIYQWYKNGSPIGEEIITQGNDSIKYEKSNIKLEDSGEYSISFKKPHAADSIGGMIINIE